MKFGNKTVSVEKLVNDIKFGELGLPEIQRPFIWPATKVRDLLDSMLRGYPIGYVMLWANNNNNDKDKGNKRIGIVKQDYSPPRQVIIDGQQRLTSLYAIFTGHPVLDEKFNEGPIEIDFNPIERKFDVRNGATKNSPEWTDVTEIFTSDTSTVLQKFMDGLTAANRPISQSEKNAITQNIIDVHNLRGFILPIFELDSGMSTEEVAEIFVRVNSQGVTLKQHDFILTLLSLYWGEGRRQIEQFSMDSRTPPALKGKGKKNGPTSYNTLIDIRQPDLVRVFMAYAFNRARLQYGYRFLRGADFNKKGEIDEKLRGERFDKLKAKLPDILDVGNWHEFVKAIMTAGYHSKEMVLSKITLFYCYAMYLIAKDKFRKLTTKKNERLTALWFFYAALLSVYGSAPEGTMESHLNEIDKFTELEEYKQFILDKIDERLTDDYFNYTLVGSDGLAVSGSGNNAWYAYVAALNILKAKPLFSDSSLLLSEKFKPEMDGTRKSVEKHHLFPKAYLKKARKLDDKAINQVANYAYIDWPDNLEILDDDPKEYYGKFCRDRDKEEIQAMEEEHALPHGWQNMKYEVFLKERRKLMAAKIRKAYEILRSNVENGV